MNWQRVQGNWEKLKPTMQQQWARLSEADLDRIGGRHEELLVAIQERHGFQRERAERQIEEFFASH